MKLNYSKAKLFLRLNALNNMIWWPKYENNWNRLRCDIKVLSNALYHLVWYTNRITYAQFVMGDYNSPKQSIWSRPWEVTWVSIPSSVNMWASFKGGNICWSWGILAWEVGGITFHFWVRHVTPHGLGQIDCSG